MKKQICLVFVAVAFLISIVPLTADDYVNLKNEIEMGNVEKVKELLKDNQRNKIKYINKEKQLPD